MDFAKISSRVKGILTTPRTEWPVAAAEPATVGGLYAGYIAIIAALPAIAGFIKGSLIGYGAFGVTVRTPIGAGIGSMLLGYVLSLVVAYVVALIVNALAPTFGGQKDPVQALKTVAYSWTAAWIGGIFTLVPWLGWLIALAGAVYAIYLLYLGLPSTMKCPPERAGGYTAVTVLIAIVLSWIVGLIVAGVIGTAAYTGAAMSGAHVSTGNDVTFDKDSALGQLAAMGKHAGEPGSVEALPPDQIKALLPEAVSDFKRTGTSASRNNTMGMQISQATAHYGDDDQSISLELTDTGSARGFMAMAAAMAPEEEKQTEHGYEKTYSADGRMIHEQWDDEAKSGEYSLVIGKRFTVKASGHVDSIDTLKDAVGEVDLDKLESLKEAGVKND